MSLTDQPVVELRQYVLAPGATDTLVRVFEAHFVETQEALGITIGGLFHDRDEPDRFVWLRGFSSMEARREALAAFYGGPVWKEHGPAANATMLDSDDVLLLRPTEPPHPPRPSRPRAPLGSLGAALAPSDEWVVVTAWLHDPDTAPGRTSEPTPDSSPDSTPDTASGCGTCAWLAGDVQPLLASSLGTHVATWRSEPAENTFPALPVRPDHAFVWTATFGDHASYAAALARLEGQPAWPGVTAGLDARDVVTEPLRLRPTARSAHPPAG